VERAALPYSELPYPDSSIFPDDQPTRRRVTAATNVEVRSARPFAPASFEFEGRAFIIRRSLGEREAVTDSFGRVSTNQIAVLHEHPIAYSVWVEVHTLLQRKAFDPRLIRNGSP
jgi:hypothetical protein